MASWPSYRGAPVDFEPLGPAATHFRSFHPFGSRIPTRLRPEAGAGCLELRGGAARELFGVAIEAALAGDQLAAVITSGVADRPNLTA